MLKHCDLTEWFTMFLFTTQCKMEFTEINHLLCYQLNYNCITNENYKLSDLIENFKFLMIHNMHLEILTQTVP